MLLKQAIIRDSVTLGAGVTTQSVVLSQLTDITKTIHFATQAGSGTTLTAQESLVKRELFLNSGVPTLRFTRVASTDSITIYYEVAEFASGVSVQHITTNTTGFTDTGSNYTKNVTISTVTVSETFVIPSVMSVAATGNNNTNNFLFDVNSTTNLRIEFDDAAPINTGENVFSCQVVSIPGANVDVWSVSMPSGSGSSSPTISAVDLSRSFLIPSFTILSSSPVLMGRTHITAFFDSTTQFTVQRQTTGTAGYYRVQVVELPSGVGVQIEQKAGIISSGSSTLTSTWTNSYDTTRSLLWIPGNLGTAVGAGVASDTDNYKAVHVAVTGFTSGGFTLTSSDSAVNRYAVLSPMQFEMQSTFRPSIIFM